MTTREHFNRLMPTLEESEFSYIYCNILSSNNINEIKELASKLYEHLENEMSLERGRQDFYNGNQEKIKTEFFEIKNDILNSCDIKETKLFATALYDALVVEKIRTYAYKVYLAGGINHYNRLAADMQDCYLDTLKEDGIYEEWKGSEYADIDCRIGDVLKLGEER